jgi:glycosyltransferase involved in cell wall biosynthesis
VTVTGPILTMVGTYPPTACGLATFNRNLSMAISAPGSGWTTRVVRILERAEVNEPDEVVAQWIAGDHASFQHAVAAMASSDAVVLQHEYGLFPGPDGEAVLELIGATRVPLVVVLHTVLRNPTAHQRQILNEVMTAASMTVVQSTAAYDRLLSTYDANPERTVVIPHGAAENFDGPILSGIKRPAVLTWGLLGPGKGIEYGISALGLLRHRSPAPTYIIAGETHPKVLATQGERYRTELINQSRQLGLQDRVHFDDRYRDWESLRALVRSVDVVLLPYDSLDQVSSGVLVEAIASGKPVVATQFPHAEELLCRGAGLIVPQGDVEAMAAALEHVIYTRGAAEEMRVVARREARALLWPTVGAKYRSLIAKVLSSSAVIGVG